MPSSLTPLFIACAIVAAPTLVTAAPITLAFEITATDVVGIDNAWSGNLASGNLIVTLGLADDGGGECATGSTSGTGVCLVSLFLQSSSGSETFQLESLWWSQGGTAPTVMMTVSGKHTFAFIALFSQSGTGGSNYQFVLSATAGNLPPYATSSPYPGPKIYQTDGIFVQFTGQEINLVPEPSPLPLLAGGLLLIAGYVGIRRKRRA